MEALLSKVGDAFIAMGPGGIFCLPLMGWIYLQSRTITELTTKLIELGVNSATATANSAAASNRLADMLSVRRNPE